MEKFLIKNMGKIIFWFGIIIFFTWLIPLFNFPVWGIINIIFGIERINQIISTQYMFTTIGAIFAFWYGYKKYERDKEIEFLQNYRILDNQPLDDIFSKWLFNHHIYKKGYLSEDVWEIINNINKTLFEVYLTKLHNKDIRINLINKVSFTLYISNDFYELIFNIIKDFLNKQEKVLNNINYLYGNQYKENDKLNIELTIKNLKILINSFKSIIEKDKKITPKNTLGNLKK